MIIKKPISLAQVTFTAVLCVAGSASGGDGFAAANYEDRILASTYYNQYSITSKLDAWKEKFSGMQFLERNESGDVGSSKETAVARIRAHFSGGVSQIGTGYVASNNSTAITAAHVLHRRDRRGILENASTIYFNDAGAPGSNRRECFFIAHRNYVHIDRVEEGEGIKYSLYDTAVLYPTNNRILHEKPIGIKFSVHDHKYRLMHASEGSRKELVSLPREGRFTTFNNTTKKWESKVLLINVSKSWQYKTVLQPSAIRFAISADGESFPIPVLAEGTKYTGILQAFSVRYMQGGPGGSGGPLLHYGANGNRSALGTYIGQRDFGPVDDLEKLPRTSFSSDLNENAVMINSALMRMFGLQKGYVIKDKSFVGKTIPYNTTSIEAPVALGTGVSGSDHLQNHQPGFVSVALPGFTVGDPNNATHLARLLKIEFTLKYTSSDGKRVLTSTIERSALSVKEVPTDATDAGVGFDLRRMKNSVAGTESLTYENMINGKFSMKIRPIFLGSYKHTVTLVEGMELHAWQYGLYEDSTVYYQ